MSDILSTPGEFIERLRAIIPPPKSHFAEFPLNVPPNFLASCTSPEAVFEPIGVGETDDEKG